MGLAQLTKEQKQYIILGVIVAAALVVLSVFGVKMSLSSLSEAKLKLEDLTAKIDRAEQTLDARDQVSNELMDSVEKLKGHIAVSPPNKNYYSWATETIYSRARQSELEIDAVDELDLTGGRAKAAAEGQMESYTLRISAQGNYESVKEFLRLLEENEQLARVTGMDIRAGKKPETHTVQIFIQWPFNLNAMEARWEKIENQKRAVRRKQASDTDSEAGVVMTQHERAEKQS